ncbi:carboxypeptidase regulatory-like domain-containing protein [Dactylosporangium sp. CA-092794]|uniref:carboxypeptidase regulatory-like domain-containing protein n=1 Tax=Dactylosporangium sp. CA-092794 TaxID=3239929 RepID=UPI003D90D2FC
MKSGSTLRSLRTLAIAALIALPGVLVPATGASAAGTGLDGTVTNALTGAPVEGAGVTIQFQDSSHWAFTNADATGHFSFPDAVAGQYIIHVQQGGYLDQWLNGKPDRYSADLITAPATLSVSLMPIQYGTIAGKVSKPGGGGLADIYVELRRNGNWVGYTGTDAEGKYHFDNIETGTYQMNFRYPSGQVVWYDNTDEWHATPIEVTPNATTTINVVRPPVGNLHIKAIDKVTKAPIANYCWYYQQAPYQFPPVCTDATGVAKLQNVPVGDYSGGGYDQAENYVNGFFGPVTVTENHTSTTVLRLEKNSKLHVDFVDSASGEAVNACFLLAEGVRNDIGYGYHCGTSVDMNNLFPHEKFRLFASAYDNVHGAQWVGRNGLGTGDPDKAKVYNPKPGEQVRVTIKLDGAGSVSGTVRDATTGESVSGSICATPSAPSASYGSNSQSACTYYSGAYLVSNLGPYQWKLAFPDYSGGHAWVWSGNAPNRAQATTVKIVAGRTKTLDVSAPAAAAISGQVTGPAGACVQCTTIYAVDATTGDYAGVTPYVFPDGTFTVKGLNTQDVWLYYTVNGNLVQYPTQFHTTAGTTQSGVTITLP